MNLFELAAKLTLDSSEFEKGVTNADKRGRGLASSLGETFTKIKKFAVGAISVAAVKKGIESLVAFATEVSNVGDKIDKQSQVLGISRKAYQEWDYILGQNGASIDSLGTSLKTLNSQVTSAANGGKESADSFAKLGLHFHELEEMSVEDQFEAVVRAFQRMPAGAKKSALALQIFGKTGMDLLPLLNQSETSIDDLRGRAEELGFVMSDDAVDASVAYNDALDDLNRTFNGLKYAVGAKLLPAMTRVFGTITGYAAKISKAYQENGLKGIWDTLLEDFQKIKWPSWSDVEKAITDGWNTIKEGIRGLAVLAFGENVDGTIAWPDLNVVIASFKTWWSEKAQPAIQKAATWVLNAFGVPIESAEELGAIVAGWWDGIVGYITDLLGWTLNVPDEPYQAGEQLRQIVTNWWKSVVGTAQSVLKWVLGIPEMKDKDGLLLKDMVTLWWNRIKGGLQKALAWFLGVPLPEDTEGNLTGALIKAWWNQNVVPKLKTVLDFTLGLFGLPPFSEMVEKIQKWWADVVAGVGELIINVGSNIKTAFGGIVDDEHDTSMYADTETRYSDAKGAWDVPYDDYRTRLHRNEMVLSASRARKYREGNGGNIDISALVSQISGAVRDGMQGATVNSYLSGRDVTDDVSRNTIRRLKARRFAT